MNMSNDKELKGKALQISRSFRFVCMLFFVSGITFRANADMYKVVGVSDGDTVTLLSKDKKQLHVRINAIDSPEKNQPYGNAAKKYLSSLIFNKEVDIDPFKLDKYGRTVATVWLSEQDVGLEMVKAGYSWVFVKYADPKIFPEYYAAEKQAKKSRTGLWSDPSSVPPWQWRHPESMSLTLLSANNEKCGKKRFCKEMVNCEEAKYYFNVCGIHSLDKDGDGIVCDKLCQ